MSLACQSDLACFRNDGHAGDHAYATPETVPQPVATPAPLDCPVCGGKAGIHQRHTPAPLDERPPALPPANPSLGATLRHAIENASDLVNPRISEVDWNDVAAHWRVRVVREYAESLGLAATAHQHNTDACDECDAIYTMGREDRSTLGTTPITLAATPAPPEYGGALYAERFTPAPLDVERVLRALRAVLAYPAVVDENSEDRIAAAYADGHD